MKCKKTNLSVRMQICKHCNHQMHFQQHFCQDNHIHVLDLNKMTNSAFRKIKQLQNFYKQEFFNVQQTDFTWAVYARSLKHRCSCNKDKHFINGLTTSMLRRSVAIEIRKKGRKTIAKYLTKGQLISCATKMGKLRMINAII